MAISKYYKDVISRHQVYLERLKAGYFKSYDKAIKESSKAITEVLQALKVETLQDITQREFNSLLKELRTAQASIYTVQAAELMEQLEKLSPEEAKFEEGALKAATIKTVINKTGPVWGKVSKAPIQATGDLLEPFVKDLTPRMISRIEKKIVTGRAQGQTITQIVNAINGTKKNNYRDGVLKTNWNDARTVVRTSVQHASTQSRVATWEANADIIDGYQWVSTLDGHTSPKCRALDLQVFQVGKGPLPPIHPGCRSTTAPYFKDDVKLWDKGATRSAEDGPTDSDETYYEWLKRQPSAFMDDAIGPVRGKLLRDGGLSAKEFQDLQLDNNFEPITLEQMKKLNPNAFEKANI